MATGSDELGLHEAFERRTRGGERSQAIIRRIVGRVVVGERADRDHVRHVARYADGHGRGSGVARRRHHHDPGLPRRHHGLVHRIIPIVGLGVRTEREVDDADVVLVLVGDDPVQARDHVHVAAAALAVEGAHDHEVGLRRDALVLQRRVLRTTGRDGGDVRAMSVGVAFDRAGATVGHIDAGKDARAIVL